MAVPRLITIMGEGYLDTAATEDATMSLPSWLWTSALMFIPVFSPGPTISGRRPVSRAMAAAMFSVIGGTTLDKIAPFTAPMSAR